MKETTFIRLLEAEDKERALDRAIEALKGGEKNEQVFSLDTECFSKVPGSPFAYWVTDGIRNLFTELPAFENEERTAKQGLATADDFRFVRAWWEVAETRLGSCWYPFAKGGPLSPYYSDVFTVVNWNSSGGEIKNNLNDIGGVRSNVWMLRDTEKKFFFRPGLTWPLRARKFSPQVLPEGCIFSVRGYCAFVPINELLSSLAIFNSNTFDFLYKIMLGRFEFPEFIVGILNQLPWVRPKEVENKKLSSFAYSAWAIQRLQHTVNETSHAFQLPALLLKKKAHRPFVWES